MTTVFDAGKLKPKYLFEKIIHFMKIQNIHSKQIFIFFRNLKYSFKKIFTFSKSSINIKKIIVFLNAEYSFKRNIHFFLKEAVSPRASVGRKSCICVKV